MREDKGNAESIVSMAEGISDKDFEFVAFFIVKNRIRSRFPI